MGNCTTNKLLRRAEIRVLRIRIGNAQISCQRNENIKKQYGVSNVLRWIKQRRRHSKEHKNRILDDRTAKGARNGKP